MCVDTPAEVIGKVRCAYTCMYVMLTLRACVCLWPCTPVRPRALVALSGRPPSSHSLPHQLEQGSVSTSTQLRWGVPADMARVRQFTGGAGYDLIIRADLLYAANASTMVAATWDFMRHDHSVLLVMSEHRAGSETVSEELASEISAVTLCSADDIRIGGGNLCKRLALEAPDIAPPTHVVEVVDALAHVKPRFLSAEVVREQMSNVSTRSQLGAAWPCTQWWSQRDIAMPYNCTCTSLATYYHAPCGLHACGLSSQESRSLKGSHCVIR
jgi:hypothetical protein